MTDHRWFEVLDDQGTNRLQCGYVNNTASLFDQLENFLPWDKWSDIYSCPPGDYRLEYAFCGALSACDKARVKEQTDTFSRFFFDASNKNQLVIIEKKNPYKVEVSRVAPGHTGPRFRPY